MKNILFINAPSCFESYTGTRVNAVVQVYPLLSHAIMAAVVKKMGKVVDILDLGIVRNWKSILLEKISTFQPDLICMSCTTPLFNEVAYLSTFIRKRYGDRIKMIAGGPHATALPEESLRLSAFDMLVVGEGEIALSKIIDGIPPAEIPGVYYKENGNIHSTPGYSYVADLDSLPFPAFELYDLQQYRCPKILNRLSPMTNYMTSRGCVYKCSFCNKNIFGNKVRYKSPEAVISEMAYMLNSGIREIRVIDDMFTTKMKRAKQICEMILQKGLKFPWTLSAGLRVDSVDLEFLQLAKKAGLYQLAFGFESGDQRSLDSIDKGIKLEQSIRAMELARKADLETVGFFMFGLPDDTEASLKKTIKFAKRLSPTYAKVTVTVPFPGTRLFDRYEKEGRIKSRDWTKYNLHSTADIYEHPHLSAETLDAYYNKFYYSFYLRPEYILRSFYSRLKDFTLFHHAYYGLQTFFPQVFKASSKRG